MSIDINISNYESYLLSYIDGELAGDELAALEVFLERNPAARQELALLEATRLKPEAGAFSFGNKAMLYRGGAINTSNYESYLLSYLDNELNAEEHGQFEQFLRQHPQVKQEMLLWNATRQYPDTSVVFENKASLYRQTEAKQFKLRPVYWWSAAAAVVAGLLIWQLPQSNDAPATTVAQQQQVKPATEQTAPATTPAETNEVNKQPDAVILAAAENASAAKTRITPPTTARVKKAAQTDNTTATPEQRKEPSTAPVIASVTAPDRQLATTDIVNKIESEKRTTTIAQADLTPRQEVKEPAIAATSREEKNQEANVVAAAAAPIQGELIMSVSSSGESKLMNGVTNVARFFSKKRK